MDEGTESRDRHKEKNTSELMERSLAGLQFGQGAVPGHHQRERERVRVTEFVYYSIDVVTHRPPLSFSAKWDFQTSHSAGQYQTNTRINQKRERGICLIYRFSTSNDDDELYYQ